MAARFVVTLADLDGGDQVWLFGRIADIIDVATVPDQPEMRQMRWRLVGQPGEPFSAPFPAAVPFAVARMERTFAVACCRCRVSATVVLDAAEVGVPRLLLCRWCTGDGSELLVTEA
jgi:hypothetical protein